MLFRLKHCLCQRIKNTAISAGRILQLRAAIIIVRIIHNERNIHSATAIQLGACCNKTSAWTVVGAVSIFLYRASCIASFVISPDVKDIILSFGQTTDDRAWSSTVILAIQINISAWTMWRITLAYTAGPEFIINYILEKIIFYALSAKILSNTIIIIIA